MDRPGNVLDSGRRIRPLKIVSYLSPLNPTMPRQLGPKSLGDLLTTIPHRNHATRVAPACNRLWAHAKFTQERIDKRWPETASAAKVL